MLKLRAKSMSGSPRSTPWLVGVDGGEVLPLIDDVSPVLRVEAPPGAGKTFGLARRIVKVMHPDGLAESAEQVLVVAFNRIIAKDLRETIHGELEQKGLKGLPKVQTLHAFCQGLVGVSESRLLLPHEREAMLFDILDANPQIRARLETKPKTERSLTQHESGHEEDIELWNECERWLLQHRGKLISDVPGELLDKLRMGEHADVRFRHVVVDEFQDLTPTEQEIVARLRSTAGSLVALGDRRQSIYAFRGNDRDGLQNLETLTGSKVTDVPMPTCRRCPQEVVEAANKLMAGDGADKIACASNTVANLHLVHFKTPSAEAKGMARAIAESTRIYSGDNHLVMVPRRRMGFALRDELLAVDPGIRIDLSFSEGILELWPVREAFLFLSLLADPDPLTWRAWFAYKTPKVDGSEFKAQARNASAYRRFFSEACNERIDRDAVLTLASEPRNQSRGTGGANVWDRAHRLKQLLDAEDWPSFDPIALINVLFDEDRWVSEGHATAEMARHDLGLLRAEALSLYQEVIDDDTALVEDSIAALELVMQELRYLIATREPFGEQEGVDVKITTLWGAKGLTAEHVFVTGLCDAAIPGVRSDDYPGTDLEYQDEQRRLFFVALTRTKRTLVLSRPEKIMFGAAKQLGLSVSPSRGRNPWADLPATQFLRSILSTLPDSVPGADWQGPW